MIRALYWRLFGNPLQRQVARQMVRDELVFLAISICCTAALIVGLAVLVLEDAR